MEKKSQTQEIKAFRAGAILSMQSQRPWIQDGVLLTAGERILQVDSYKALKPELLDVPLQDLGSSSIMAPGLINAHTHLELSHLQGRTQLGQGFEPWVQSLIKLPLSGVEPEILQSTLLQLGQNGTICVGDISSHNPRQVLAQLQGSGLEYLLFLEFLGFSALKSRQLQWPKGLNPKKQKQLSLSGHALYSTHPGTLQLAKDWTLRNKRPFALHLAEHAGEVELLATGRGGLAELLKGALLPEDYVPPGMSPVRFADSLGLLDGQTLAVHCVHLSPQDLEILQERGCYVCLCPRSNNNINVGRAPWEKMLQAGMPLCLGTDSLASNQDLDLWSEAEHLLRYKQIEIKLPDLLRFMTMNPARILGLERSLGSLQPGKRAAFSLVPQRIQDILL
ncbi:MAG: amidohydrolase family protein [Desulfohalobiaceae bacterium]